MGIVPRFPNQGRERNLHEPYNKLSLNMLNLSVTFTKQLHVMRQKGICINNPIIPVEIFRNIPELFHLS